MDITTREDIEVPQAELFEMITDFSRVERSILRRGAQLRRVDNLDGPCVGMSWVTDYDFRGKTRTTEATLAEFERPGRMVFETNTGGLDTQAIVELVALSRSRTRMTLTAHMTPKSLSGRLLVQSLRLARGSIVKRLRVWMADLAKELEDRHKRTA